jgi:hypothetical protein
MTGTPEFKMFNEAKKRATVLAIPFTISLDDIHIPESCPALGIPLVPGEGLQNDASPSLDRLRPELGYTPGNVAVISLAANRIKQDASSAQVLAVADWMDSLGL